VEEALGAGGARPRREE
jgi:hypothetical protein